MRQRVRLSGSAVVADAADRLAALGEPAGEIEAEGTDPAVHRPHARDWRVGGDRRSGRQDGGQKAGEGCEAHDARIYAPAGAPDQWPAHHGRARLGWSGERYRFTARRSRQRPGLFGVRTGVRAQAHAGGRLRPCAPARGTVQGHAPRFGPRLSHHQGRQGGHRRGGLEGPGARPGLPAGAGAGGHRHRADHHLSRLVQIPDRHRIHGAGRRRRPAGPA